MKAFLKNLPSDFRFWLMFFFLIRLIGVTNPPLEIGHSWRQVTGLMVTRNFAEVDSDIRFPRIDDNQGGTGIIGMEFPVLNYLHYTMGCVLGHTNWYGRLINLLVSSLGLWFFYSLVLKVFQHQKLAFTAGLVLAASSWFAYSRKTMPDTFCISLIIIALYCAIQYLETKKTLNLLLYILLSTLATLSKIPAAMYLVFLIPLSLNSTYQIKTRLILLFFTVIPISLTYYWYYMWNPYLEATYGNWYNIGKPLLIGFKELVENPKQTLDNFYFDAFSSFSMFGLFMVGLFLVIYNKEILIIKLFALFALIFAIYMIKSGFYFYHHSYYILPMVPFMALIAAYTLTKIQKRWVYIAFIVIGIGEGIANQQHDFFIKPSEKYKLELEALIDKVSSRNQLVMVNGNNNPQLMYFAHRKGWNCYNHELVDTSYLYQAKRKGCKLVIVNKHGCDTRPPLKLVLENDNFAVFRY